MTENCFTLCSEFFDRSKRRFTLYTISVVPRAINKNHHIRLTFNPRLAFHQPYMTITQPRVKLDRARHARRTHDLLLSVSALSRLFSLVFIRFEHWAR